MKHRHRTKHIQQGKLSWICLKVIIHGRVQGVWFRDATKNKARELGVTGWVKNNPDKTVTAMMQGTEEAVNNLLHWCHSGPPLAKVERVEQMACPEGVAFLTDFEIHS